VGLLPDVVTRPAARLGAAGRNALEVARFGGLETGEVASPFDVVAERRVYRLRRYYPDAPAAGPPIVLVPPMMLAADVYDVSPSASGVATLHEHGVDPWVVDFGAPEHEEGGLERNLADHVLAIDDAVDRVRKHTGRDVHLGGYSQGGMFCYQTAAYRRSRGIASVVTFGSPVDLGSALPLGIPPAVAMGAAGFLVDRVLGGGALPAWASRAGFRLLDPVKSIRQRIDFLRQLHDREALLPRERQRQFLDDQGWVAWPGPALADFIAQFVEHNRMVSGGFLVEDRLVTLADLTCPLLCFVGDVDEIAPPRGVRAIRAAAPRADVYEMTLHAGHFGLVVGGTARRTTWPAVAGWLHWREGDGELPSEIEPMEEPAEEDRANGSAWRSTGLELAAGIGLGAARSVATTATRTAGAVKLVTEEAVRQLPRLARLERIQPSTRVSLGLLLEEQARRTPDGVFFLFEGRAHTWSAVSERIDNVVRGLIAVGVRQGEHVGVLMGTRPSALTLVAALNRLGAVAVLLRPDGEVQRELELGRARRVIADPELAGRAREAGADEVLVLGGGGGARDLGPDVVDMERIDPAAVDLPAWFAPNGGRARDLALVLFAGEGEHTRANRITNRRCVLSAFGTASSASLSEADTVYSMTPIYHPSSLLMSIGGAIAGGSRLALATQFDPENFWDEVRRYGVTVVSYTWTMLRELVDAPAGPGERHHPVRLFIGAGMPRGLWRRVNRRFSSARVLEFYASTEGEIVLANVSGAKPGSKGRPLPGSAEARLAAYDAETGRLEEGPDGFARPAARGEAGMLLARARSDVQLSSEAPLRGVFATGDAWMQTQDLFRQDDDGDFWLLDHAPSLIRTAEGPVPALPILDALGDLDTVDLSVAYGVQHGEREIAVAAVTLCRERTLDPDALAGALRGLPVAERPAVVHVVGEIPLTTWYRPVTAPLRAKGVPRAGRKAWVRDGEAYVPLTQARRQRLLSQPGPGR
jgi:putative long chain acyl-CoA synthase